MAPGTNLSILAHENTIPDTTPLPKKTVPTKLNPATKGATILHPSLITQDFDLLRFSAAASQQLSTSTTTTTPANHSTLLISSPYNNPGHYLDLTTLSLPDLIFAKALTALKPEREDYATASYTTSLNFSSTILPLVRELAAAEEYTWKQQSFYVVIFRSKLQADIDNDWLYKLDYESHGEACESGGLLKYWFGKTDGERRNLATCFWRSREDARKGGLGPWHAKARAAGRSLYEYINFSTHRFTILDGAEEFRFEDWTN
ncbi:hypothetical protein DM02DRAFT_528988 [Periconia macrospinosa]|uniref:Uncharacterized protein n=1 Tax=Periconia macrospinosa TaxID=97972 RepID=A0A2V1DQ55_9PLEO|nr:hypothetical protein DM02DRAFT_528988 [Periconia macrospinosa]